jgi:hypothetical protein
MMQSALIVDAVLLAAVLEADLGHQRKIGKLRLLRPLGIAAGIIPLYLKAVTTHGNGAALEVALGAAGVILGVVAMLLTRTVAMGIRARHIAHIGSGTAARLLQPA